MEEFYIPTVILTSAILPLLFILVFILVVFLTWQPTARRRGVYGNALHRSTTPSLDLPSPRAFNYRKETLFPLTLSTLVQSTLLASHFLRLGIVFNNLWPLSPAQCSESQPSSWGRTNNTHFGLAFNGDGSRLSDTIWLLPTTLRGLRKLPSPPRVVILSNFEFDEEIYRAVEAGAMGYLLKDTSRDEIINAVKAVHAGHTYFPRRIEARLLERKQRHDLSAREVEILELLSKGLTNKAIGQALGISAFTVRNHVNRILEKLQVCDRTEASTVAIEQGILLMHHS